MKGILIFSTLIIVQAVPFHLFSQGFDEGYVKDSEGARLYYRVLGKGRDSIVVLHGGPGAGMNSILPSVRPLAERHVLIFYDQRGGGRSELPRDTLKLRAQDFVEDLEMVRRHFRLNQMNVIAHSFGSVLLAEYAKRHPDRLGRVLFHGATGPRRPEAGRYYAVKATIPPADTALAAKAARLLKLLLSGDASDPVATCQEYERIGRQLAMMRGESLNYRGTTCDASAEAVRYYYRYTAQIAPQTFGVWDFTTGLEGVKAPLLVIYGVKDSLGIPMQRAWTTAFPDSRLLLIPHAGKTLFQTILVSFSRPSKHSLADSGLNRQNQVGRSEASWMDVFFCTFRGQKNWGAAIKSRRLQEKKHHDMLFQIDGPNR